jgi:hypothetical protein
MEKRWSALFARCRQYVLEGFCGVEVVLAGGTGAMVMG